MRVVFVGAGMLTVVTARSLLRGNHEVVVIERDRATIDQLAEELDCGFLHGDGNKPAVLREADPAGTDFLFCLTGNDQTNILAGLVGRSLGFRRVITKVDDEELEHICIELGLTETIIPDNTIAHHLADLVEGQDIGELALMIKGDARVFSFVARKDDAGPLAELDLPDETRLVCIYREGEFLLPNARSALEAGDEVVLISHRSGLGELMRRWGPKADNGADAGTATQTPNGIV